MQPAGLVYRCAAVVVADDARPRTVRRPPRGRSGPPGRHRPSGAARHPRPVGTNRRIWTRTRGGREEATAPAGARSGGGSDGETRALMRRTMRCLAAHPIRTTTAPRGVTDLSGGAVT